MMGGGGRHCHSLMTQLIIVIFSQTIVLLFLFSSSLHKHKSVCWSMIAFPGQVIVTPVMITPSSHDEPLTSQNSSEFWKPLTSDLENNLSSAHCLPGNIQINLPVAKFVVFGKDNVPSRFNLPSIASDSENETECLMSWLPAAWPWAGPGSASSRPCPYISKMYPNI